MRKENPQQDSWYWETDLKQIVGWELPNGTDLWVVLLFQIRNCVVNKLVRAVSPKLWEHAGTIEVEGTVDPVECDQEHQDDQNAQRLEKCSLFPPGTKRQLMQRILVWSDGAVDNQKSYGIHLWIKLPPSLPFEEVTRITSWTWKLEDRQVCFDITLIDIYMRRLSFSDPRNQAIVRVQSKKNQSQMTEIISEENYKWIIKWWVLKPPPLQLLGRKNPSAFAMSSWLPLVCPSSPFHSNMNTVIRDWKWQKLCWLSQGKRVTK